MPGNVASGASSRAMQTLVLLVGTAMNMLSRGLIETFAVFLLPLSVAFATDRVALTGIYSTYMLVYGLTAPFIGMLIDKLGVRLCYSLGLLLVGAGLSLAGHANQLWQLYLTVGAMCGAGTAALGMVPASVLASRWFDRRLPSAMSLLYAALGSGVLVFSPLSQWLIDSGGWRHAYRWLGLTPLIILPLTLLLPWSRILAGEPSLSARRARSPGPALGAALGHALRQPDFWRLSGVMFFTTLSTFTIMIQLVAYLVEVGFAALIAASVFGALGIISTVGMMTVGMLAERFGERLIATLSYSCSILGVGILALLDGRPSMLLLAAFAIVFGTVSGSRGPLVAVLSSRRFGGSAQATVYGSVLLAMGIGGAIAGWATGALHDLTDAYHAGFLLSALAALGGMLLFRSIDVSR
ncbi:MAG: MFS transporter [Burkholderiaceae bacterium]